MKHYSIPDLAEVASLGSAGERGRVVVLTTDSCLYYDNGTEWVNISGLLSTVTESGASVTIGVTHRGKEVLLTNAGDVTLTLDDTTTVGTDFLASYRKMGTGRLTVALGGMTARNNFWKPDRYSRTLITAIGTDEFLVAADEPLASVVLTDGATVAVDPMLGRRFRLDTGNSRTIGNPGAGSFDGQPMTIYIKNTSGGSVTPTFTTGATNAFRFNSVLTVASAVAAGKIRYWTAQWNDPEDRWDILAESGEF